MVRDDEEMRAASTGQGRTRPLLPLALLVGDVLLALGIFLVGPKHDVICTHASFPYTLVGDYFGHVDGPRATYCLVPTTGAWVTTGLLVIAGILVALYLARRASRRPRP